jgi:hypothetical protein
MISFSLMIETATWNGFLEWYWYLSVSTFSDKLDEIFKVAMESRLKKFLNPFCFACTLGLLTCLSTKLNEYS